MADEEWHEPDRWIARPGLARLVRGVALLAPLTLAVIVSAVLARWLPPAETPIGVAGRWLGLCGVSTVGLVVVDRFARRLLPLAALLRLSLAFPDRAPSRYKLARSVATTRQLEAEIATAREVGIVGDREQAAEKVLQLVAALSVHDRATRGHAERVRIFTDMIADEMGLDTDETARLRWASLLHDVGKIFVHPDILNKPGQPTEQEWEVLRTHPLEGARLAAPLQEWLGSWTLTIEQHHERWDGGGYPFGLSGREISLGARIVAVADAFDVMTSARSYKRPMTAAAARADLAKCAGSQFDPRVVRAFLALSLSRVRWAVGPLAWLLNLPMVRLVPLQSVTPASAALPSGMTSMAAMTTTAVAASSMGVIGLPALADVAFASGRGPRPAVATDFPDVDERVSSDVPDVADRPAATDPEQDEAIGTLAGHESAPSSPPEDDHGEEEDEGVEQQASTGPAAGAPAPRTHAGTTSTPTPVRPEPADAPAPRESAAPQVPTPPRPDGAPPGAGQAPPRPDGAGPGAGGAAPVPDRTAPVEVGTSPSIPAPDTASPPPAPLPEPSQAPDPSEAGGYEPRPAPTATAPEPPPSPRGPRSATEAPDLPAT